jgi:hypothetical protein
MQGTTGRKDSSKSSKKKGREARPPQAQNYCTVLWVLENVESPHGNYGNSPLTRIWFHQLLSTFILENSELLVFLKTSL